MADLAFTVDYKQLKAANAELERTGKVSKNSAQAFEAAFSQVVKWQQKFATEQGKVSAKLEETYRKQNLANKSARESAKAFEEAERATKRLAQTKDELSRKYKPLYAQSKLYERALDEINQANRLGVLTDKQRQTTLDQLNRDFQKGTGVFATYANAAGKNANRMGVAMQQTGYQVGDFLVQVQSGTNPMVAFGQQATQLVGIMYLLPTATLAAKRAIWGLNISLAGVTLGLSIIIPLLTAAGAAFMGSSKAGKTLDDVIGNLSSSFNDYISSIKSAKDNTKSLMETYGRITPEIIELEERLQKLQLRQIALDAKEAADALSDFNFGDWNPFTGTLNEIQRFFGTTIDSARTLKRALDAVGDANGPEESLAAIQHLAKVAVDAAGGIENVDGEMLKFLRQITKSEQEFQKLVNIMGLSVNASKDIATGLSDAVSEAVKLRDAMEAVGRASLSRQDQISVVRAKIAAARSGTSVSGAQAQTETAIELSRSGATADQIAQAAKAAGEQAAVLESLENTLSGILNPEKPSGGSKTSERNEKYLDNLLRETKLKAQLVGVSEQEAAKLKLLNTLEAKGIDLNDDRVKTLIEEQKNLAELEKAYEAQQEMVGMFKDTLTNALMSVIDGSRSVADAFKNMMRQILSSLAQKSIIQPLVSGLTGGIAGGAAGGLMGGLAAGTGIAATMGTIGSSLGAGFMTSVYGGLAGTAGAVSGGLAVGGTAGVATAIGAVAAPLLAVAAVFSFFKKKVKELDSGISATVTNMDSYVESFSTIQTKRFWGLSKKVSTNTTAMDADNPISLAIASVQQSIFSTAQYLGIATDSLSAFSYEFKLSLKGLSEEAKMQKIAEEVNKLGDAFANLLPNVLNMEHLTAIMDERYSLETRLLEAQGNTEALRERELANTNEYNRAILEQIFAAEDAKAALDNLNNSLKETDFATLLDFNRAKAYARLGMNVANSPEVPSMSNTAASGVQAITNPMNTASGEIVQLRSEMKEMHKEAMFAYSKLIKNGKDSRDTLRSWDVVGLPAERTA